jgi:hypothetical protein
MNILIFYLQMAYFSDRLDTKIVIYKIIEFNRFSI